MRVNGVGPRPCERMIIGENSGYYEDRYGYPFVAGMREGRARRPTSGDELERLLEANALPPRDEWFLSNVFKTYKGKDYDYGAADLAENEPALLEELETVRPSLIVTLGRAATRYLLGDVDMDGTHGIPWQRSLCGDCGKVFDAGGATTRRLLAVGDGAEGRRARAGEGLPQPAHDVRTPSGVRPVHRGDTVGQGTGSPLQPLMVRESLSPDADDASDQHAARISDADSLPKRASSCECLSSKVSDEVTEGWSAVQPRVPGVQTRGKEALLEPPQEPLQHCPACGSANYNGVVVFVAFHPAAGMHNSDLASYVVADFQALAAYMHGSTTARVLYDDPYPEPAYEELTTPERLDAELGDGATHLAVDCEGWPERAWSLQCAHQPGRAGLIRASRRDLTGRFVDAVHRTRPRLVFHAALADFAIGRGLGIDFVTLADTCGFDDTAVMAYLLQLEPRGLKDGALRHCNMRMMSYTDLMGDVENDLARDYLTWLWENEAYDYRQRQEEILAAKQAAGSRARKLPSIQRTALHKAVERCLRSNEPARLWGDQADEIRASGERLLGQPQPATLDYVSPERAVTYGCRDADATLRLLPEYRRRVADLGLADVYDLECATYPLIDRMQRIGLKPDLGAFAALSGRLAGELVALQNSLGEATGLAGFNANSGDQVAAYVFGTLGLDEIKLTSSGRGSTNDKILEALEREHPEFPVLADIRTYRELYKLKSTFVDPMPEYVHRWPFDGRVHATFRTTTVVSGRLSASDPNVLAQPEHGTWARDFKRGWVCDEGHVLCAWDQSQIELRVLAHLSQDAFLLRAFRDGVDLHAALAERIFGVAPGAQDKHRHRYPAKTIHYLMCMGGTSYGLMQQLRANGVEVDESTAQQWMDETFALYAGVPAYMRARVEEAERTGMVRSLLGRIRYIGGIHSRDERIRAEAERFAVSFPLQSGAQDVMKQCEVRVWREVLPAFWSRGIYCEPLLQQHDSLKFEVDENAADALHRLMRAAMTEVPNGLSVPLAVDGEYGPTFADMQAFN